MERLWAPWRKAYIRPKSKRSKACLFCGLLSKGKDQKHFIVKRSRYSFAILNLFPYNNGHVMIVPKRHVADLSKLHDREKLDWLKLHDEILAALKKTIKPHGFNVGINMGRIAGAGIPDHIHLHIVPRWLGDSNFMPIIGETKVVSESLESVYDALLTHLKKESTGKRLK